MVSELRDYLVAKLDTNMRDRAYTLRTRRSNLQFCQVIAGIDVQEVIDKINSVLAEDDPIAGMSTRDHAIPIPKF